MEMVHIIKTARFIVAGLVMMFAVSSMVVADEVAGVDNSAQEVVIKGTVVQAEDVCGIIAVENIYIITCDQVNGFDGKVVNVIGLIAEEGDVQTIDATSVQTIELKP